MSGQKKGKGKVIGVIVAIIVIAAGGLCWFSGLVGGISEAEAQEIALAQVPDAGENPSVLVMQEFDDLSKTYDVQVSANGMLYEFKILARNGRIVEQDVEGTGMQAPAAQPDPSAGGTDSTAAQPTGTDIGVERAKEIALAEVAGAAATDITEAVLDSDDGRLSYEISIRYDGQEYDFDIDAATGEIISRSQESVLD